MASRDSHRQQSKPQLQLYLTSVHLKSLAGNKAISPGQLGFTCKKLIEKQQKEHIRPLIEQKVHMWMPALPDLQLASSHKIIHMLSETGSLVVACLPPWVALSGRKLLIIQRMGVFPFTQSC